MSRFSEWEGDVGHLPDDTCPAIDTVQKNISEVQGYAKSLNAFEHQPIKEFLSALDHEFWETDGTLENIRDANRKLREHAEFWKDKTEECVVVIEGIKEKVDEL